MRALKFAGAAIAVVIVIIALVAAVGIPSSFLTSAITERVERETGYTLSINGGAKIGLWPTATLTLSDVVLQDPREREANNRFAADRVEAEMTLSSLWSGQPDVTDLVIVKPVINLPLQRERTRDHNPPAKSSASGSGGLTIRHVSVTGGTIVFSNVRDRVESRIETLNADATIGNDRKIVVMGSASASGKPLKFEIRATAPQAPLERQNVPAEFNIDAPGLLPAAIKANAEVRLNGTVVMFNGVSGTLGDGGFTGWASVDFASNKPLVKLDLDFQRITMALTPSQPDATQPLGTNIWSNATIDLGGLNYVDAQARISTAELVIGDGRFAQAAIDASVDSGVLKARLANLGAYEGTANGDLTIDARGATPSYALRLDLAGVRALPVLKSLAEFDKLDGKMQAKIALTSQGTSARAIVGNLGGTAFVVFQDGKILGLNVAQMIRNLTTSTLSGWQQGQELSTDLSQLSASFKLDKGQAVTTDLNSDRPAGEDERGRHRRYQHPPDRVPGRAAARDDHRRPGPRRQSGRPRHPRDDRGALGVPADLSGDAGHPRQSPGRLCQAQGDGQGFVRRERPGAEPRSEWTDQPPQRPAGRWDRHTARHGPGAWRCDRRPEQPARRAARRHHR
ncbi:uncharacterized protein involved in outer membrane biogenesis [Bradyrhizobium sp. JR6.1]